MYVYMYTLGILYLVPYPQAHRVFRLPSHSFILMFPDFGQKSQILSYIRLCLCYSRIWFINKYFVKINFEVSPMFRQTPYPSMISDVFRWYWNQWLWWLWTLHGRGVTLKLDAIGSPPGDGRWDHQLMGSSNYISVQTAVNRAWLSNSG
jgi:hypothetical protein